jgi:hypothetical protein
MKVGILGYGEVGKAIANFINKPLIKDIGRDDFIGKKIGVLHVCIPDSVNFEKIVGENILSTKPKLVIIHSTVAVGKTKNLFQKFGNVVHSPVRGVHPNLYQGIKTFIKFVGADNKKLGKKAAEHLREIGIKNVKVYTPSATTELGKLLDTTYYGFCIAYHAYANKLCKKTGADFEGAMTDFNISYNEGYKKLGKKNVIRPVLYPPQDDKITGHCVVQNTEILNKIFGEDEILKCILRHK